MPIRTGVWFGGGRRRWKASVDGKTEAREPKRLGGIFVFVEVAMKDSPRGAATGRVGLGLWLILAVTACGTDRRDSDHAEGDQGIDESGQLGDSDSRDGIDDTVGDDDGTAGEHRCGNGMVEAGELCDGNCPTDCPDQGACRTGVIVGSAASCTAICDHEKITQCQDNDGCCPGDCGSQDDSDCAADLCAGQTCSGHGTCVVDDGQSACLCAGDYHPEGLDFVERYAWFADKSGSEPSWAGTGVFDDTTTLTETGKAYRDAP